MRRKLLSAAVLALALTAMIPLSCYADITGSDGRFPDPVTVSIPSAQHISGRNYRGGDRFSFILEADEEDAPMPEGSDGSTRTVTVRASNGRNKIDWGGITFERPGVFHYTITRPEEEHERFKTDDAEYKVMLAVLNDGTSEMTIYRLAEDRDDTEGGKSDEVLYKDVYDAPPKTGDNERMVLLSASAAISGSVLILIMLLRRRRDNDEEGI